MKTLPLILSLLATFACRAGLAGQGRPKSDSELSSVERALKAMCPADGEVPNPLVPYRTTYTRTKAVTAVKRVFRCARTKHVLVVEILDYGTAIEALARIRCTKYSYADRTAVVPIPEDMNLGDFGLMINPDRLAVINGQTIAPPAYDLQFVRGTKYVELSYVSDVAGFDESGRPWMNGDPIGEVWRVARLVDHRIQLQSKNGKRSAART